MFYVGIDPGKSGGIACLNRKGKIIYAISLPESEWDLWMALTGHKIDRLIVENVSSSPQMGVVSAFTFGKGYGTILGMLTVLSHTEGLRFEETRPQVWQKGLGIPPRKKKRRKKKNETKKQWLRRTKGQKEETEAQFKNRLRRVAQQLFPKFELWKEPRTIGKQLAICDALLIAESCRRTYV